jgi:hypothetical protein
MLIYRKKMPSVPKHVSTWFLVWNKAKKHPVLQVHARTGKLGTLKSIFRVNDDAFSLEFEFKEKTRNIMVSFDGYDDSAVSNIYIISIIQHFLYHVGPEAIPPVPKVC